MLMSQRETAATAAETGRTAIGDPLRSQAESGFVPGPTGGAGEHFAGSVTGATILRDKRDTSMPADEHPPAADDDRRPRQPSAAELAGQSRIIDSSTLFQGAQELLIQHGEQMYRLRQTRNGKLILNK